MNWITVVDTLWFQKGSFRKNLYCISERTPSVDRNLFWTVKNSFISWYWISRCRKFLKINFNLLSDEIKFEFFQLLQQQDCERADDDCHCLKCTTWYLFCETWPSFEYFDLFVKKTKKQNRTCVFQVKMLMKWFSNSRLDLRKIGFTYEATS